MAFKDPNTQIVLIPIVDSLDKVDEKYKELYAETTDGKFQLKAELAFQSDFENTRNALQKEREISKALNNKYKELEAKYNAFDGLDPTAVKGMRTELENLKSNETDLNKVKSSKAELEIKFKDLQNQFNELAKMNETYLREKKITTLKEKARQALHQNGMPDYALDDGLMYAEKMLEMTDDGTVRVKKDNALNTNYPEGVTVETWAGLMKKNKPHLFGGSLGGGAGGSNDSPTAIDSWLTSGENGGINVTQLAKAALEDPKGTLAMARRAGKANEILQKFPYLFPKDAR